MKTITESMNLFDVMRQLEKNDTQTFTNGFNTITTGDDSYEFIFKDIHENKTEVMICGWRKVEDEK